MVSHIYILSYGNNYVTYTKHIFFFCGFVDPPIYAYTKRADIKVDYYFDIMINISIQFIPWLDNETVKKRKGVLQSWCTLIQRNGAHSSSDKSSLSFFFPNKNPRPKAINVGSPWGSGYKPNALWGMLRRNFTKKRINSLSEDVSLEARWAIKSW